MIAKRMCALLTAGGILLGTNAVLAAELNGEVSYKTAEQKIVFSGTALGAQQNVTLQVYSKATEKVIAVLQEKADANGNFEFKIPFNEVGTGDLMFVYNCAGNEAAKIAEVYFDASLLPDDEPGNTDSDDGSDGSDSGTGGSSSSGGSSSYGGSSSGRGGMSFGYAGSSLGNPLIRPKPPQFEGYDDVDANHWAKASIDKLTLSGVLSGVGENLFMPDTAVTREEFVKMIVAAFEMELIVEGELPFEDVQPGEWYYDYLRTAFKYGLINGIDEKTFGTGDQITRQDVCVILQNAADVFQLTLPKEEKEPFADRQQIADYARSSVDAMYQAGIVVGVDENCFAPTDVLTRAMAAVLIDRILQWR